jgi:hypothetical protein
LLAEIDRVVNTARDVTITIPLFISFVRAVPKHAVTRLLRRCYRTNPRKSSEQWSCPLQANALRQSLVIIPRHSRWPFLRKLLVISIEIQNNYTKRRKQTPSEICTYNCVRFDINPLEHNGNFIHHQKLCILPTKLIYVFRMTLGLFS